MANAALAPDGPPDEELLDCVRSGGRAGDAAVTAIYKRYRLPLLRFFVSQGLNPDDASDVLQDTVIRIVRGAASYTGEGAARSWIWQVARNSLTDVLRKRKLLREHGVWGATEQKTGLRAWLRSSVRGRRASQATILVFAARVEMPDSRMR